MSNTTAASKLPPIGRRGLTNAEQSLLGTMRSKASWIWTTEDNPPNSPHFEQRAFRKYYNFPTGMGRPVNSTIVVAADDYFSMYINGVLVHPEDVNHDFLTILAFNIPIPVVSEGPSNSMLLGFRVVNKEGYAGLLVATQINFDLGGSDIFYTGLDQSWLGERSFQEHWEQPWFDTSPQSSAWRPADVYPPSVRRPSEPQMAREEVVVFGQLATPSDGAGPAVAPTPADGRLQGGPTSIELTTAGFAGMMVGTILASILLGALGAYFLTKMKYRRVRTDDPDPSSIYEPETKPGRRIHAPHHSESRTALFIS